MITVNSYLYVAAFIFTTGVLGVLIRRNAIVILMSIELMLNAVNLTFIAFANHLQAVDGKLFVFFILAVAAAEAAVGLAIIVALFKTKGSTSVDDYNLLKW